MKFKITQLSESIHTGFSFRERVANDLAGDCMVIQPKDISPNSPALLGHPQKVDSAGLPSKQLLQKGDVLLLAKGNKNFAWVFNLDFKAVTTSLFFVIRPDKTKVTSDYLCWYLNQEATQGALHAAKAGTIVTNLAIGDLSQLEIKVPSLLTQNKLVNLYQLWQIEKTKTMNIIKQKDTFFNNLVLAEIEREHEVPPFTDEFGQWMGYQMLSMYNIADIKFKERVFLKGHNEPVNQMLAIITHLETYGRQVHFNDGSMRGYTAVKDWHLVEFKNLREYNNAPIPQNERNEKYLNIVPHSLIESIVMRDRFGNIVTEQ